MNVSATLKALGALLLFLGFMLLTPLPFSFYFKDGAAFAFMLSAVAASAAGAGLFFAISGPIRLNHREGFAIVSLGWIAFAVFGSLPFLLSGEIPNPVDAFFEAMSGITTTGATVISDLDPIAESILFWRATLQWMGGMGIIVLTIAVLPFLGVGGMQLFQAEVPGPTADRLSPRIQDTAKLLWGVYFIFTLVEFVLLMLGGMSFFEAICHAFATMSTGGFSTENASLGGFDSAYLQFIVVLFMFLAGVNFSLHFYALRGAVGNYWKSSELKFYITIVAASFAVVFFGNLGGYESHLRNALDSAFQVIAIITTTGFVTADYELWPVLSQYVLVFLMLLGGCAGSTAGGMKCVRLLLLMKHAYHQIFLNIHPRGVRNLKIDHKTVPNEVIQGVLGFFALYIGIFVGGSMVMAFFGLDFMTAAASVIACLGNVGPGLGEVGPTDNFAGIPALGKLVLAGLMLLGRLEIFTLIVLAFPSFWKR